MALSGKLIADFASFYDAVQKAEVSLRSFEGGAGKVETSLNRMVDSFSGRKVITDATLMAEAVERIGGTSKLTEAELARVSATANEAANKMRAMGVDVPPGLQKIADATKQATVAGEGWSTQLSEANRLLSVFGIGLSVGAVVNFGRSVLQAGDSIQKMSDQTHLSTEEVQRFMYISGQTATPIESLVGAVQNLQQKLGDHDAGAVGALAKLNINLDTFSRLNSYQQMTTLATAVQSIKDPTQQASIAADLFGKTWKELLPAIVAGMKEVGDQAPVMSDHTVKGLDRIGDALIRAHQQATAWGGAVVLAIEEVGFQVGDLLSVFDSEHFGHTTSWMLRMSADLNDPDGLKRALDTTKPPAVALGEAIGALGMSMEEATRIEKALTETAKESIVVNKEAAEAVKRLDDAYDKMISDARNAEGMAQFNDAAAAMERAAKNAEGVWLMERDAWQLSVKEKDTAAAALVAQEAEFARAAQEGFTVVGAAMATHDGAVEATTQKWHGLGAAAAAAVKLMVPPSFDWEGTYAKAGIVAGVGAGGILPSAPPTSMWGNAGSVNNTIYVNGTAEDVAHKIMDEITRGMNLSGRKWPAN